MRPHLPFDMPGVGAATTVTDPAPRSSATNPVDCRGAGGAPTVSELKFTRNAVCELQAVNINGKTSSRP